jgi:hypothetical protein
MILAHRPEKQARWPKDTQSFCVRNASRQDVVLAQRAVWANTPISRFWGLMGRPGLAPGEGLWIEPCADIHSCFMRFLFDAVFVSRDGEVLHVVHAMRPWRMSRFVLGARSVLELPAGCIHETDTQVGHLLVREPRAQ